MSVDYEIKTVEAKWVHIEDMPPSKKVMCLCKDGRIRFGIPICGDGYFYVDTKNGYSVVEFWQEIPELKKIQETYWSKD